jgi:hypothetical protein
MPQDVLIARSLKLEEHMQAFHPPVALFFVKGAYFISPHQLKLRFKRLQKLSSGVCNMLKI